MQWQGHQVYFTPLLEYQLNRESARPAFSISFYTELMEEKKIVLMLGQSTAEGTLSSKDAQHLVYQLQLFYMTGSEEQKALVEKFWKSPQEFDYQEQIRLLTTL
jgi:ATP synthase F1 complex assembly factor 1